MFISSFNICVFKDANEKLKSMLSQPSSEFDSILFLFNKSVRYKFLKSELGIQSVSDLLFPNGYGIYRNGHGQSYYLYYNCVGFQAGIDRLQGTVYSYSGTYAGNHDLHIFIDRSRKNMKLLYFKDDRVILESRRLTAKKYALSKQERKAKYSLINWKRMNEILSSRVEK